ncbi:hypothetical protein HNY73_015053 [Argiope bruennichi]|uniref:Uncharacterized protein n=1 Tax=Argiope bruennichi TaxID=94029 RepID=A0A8T0EQY1_ARGBR|nr:hypothetical protein HNY73_015053 [Argiope bruennichi]
MVSLCIILFINRFCLCLKINRLKNIPKLLSKFEATREGSNLKIKIFAYLFVACQILIIICKGFTKLPFMDMVEHFFGLHSHYPLVNDIINTLHEFSVFLFCVLPTFMFTFFYINVCSDLKHVIKKFQQYISGNAAINYKDSLHDLSSMKSNIELIDEELGFLVLMTIFYNTCIMCLSFYMFFDRKLFRQAYVTFPTLWFFVTSLGSFIGMMASATMVAEASEKISSNAASMPENAGESFSVQQRFIMFAEKGVHLTVWKIAPIKRSFIFGIIGVIFTYTLMFYNLSPVTNENMTYP